MGDCICNKLTVEFEQAFANFCDAKVCIAVSPGLDTLAISDEITHEVLRLPMSPVIRDSEIEYVVKPVNSWVD
jgi:dTDP-4-amino-4,6-dideoxygalactose transaminase